VIALLGPGIARGLPYCEVRAMSPAELKTEGIRLHKLTGLGKRECARAYGKSWELVRGWLQPKALDRCPPPRFVQWLKLRADSRAAADAAARLLEAL
jgi:hypothetical protein